MGRNKDMFCEIKTKFGNYQTLNTNERYRALSPIFGTESVILVDILRFKIIMLGIWGLGELIDRFHRCSCSVSPILKLCREDITSYSQQQ